MDLSNYKVRRDALLVEVPEGALKTKSGIIKPTEDHKDMWLKVVLVGEEMPFSVGDEVLVSDDLPNNQRTKVVIDGVTFWFFYWHEINVYKINK